VLIENELTVAAAPDDVYRLMLDVERVAPCIPGAEVTGARDGGGHDARMKVKIGPVSMSYAGSVEIVERDDAARTAVMRAKGSEARGQGTAEARMTMAVTGENGSSHVKVSTDLNVTGRVAQMGKGIMQDVATRMLAEMARCMETRLAPDAPATAAADAPAAADEPRGSPAAARPAAPPPPPPPAPARELKALPLLWGVLVDRVKRLVGRLRRR
jgi:carbon monoxide dehydrogenase subunit G